MTSGTRAFDARRFDQVIIRESLMDAKTLVLTANMGTVHGMRFLDLKTDGPTAVEAPPKILGAGMDTLQRFLMDIGPLSREKKGNGKEASGNPEASGFLMEFPPRHPAERVPVTLIFSIRRGWWCR
ncbi:MAG: DUF1254 domain-containing protein [Verrucomicrobiaceae bacterium]|nr:MAG: DUF1254 domain-containing protein [Verrucomicrobiaceae bacterium]